MLQKVTAAILKKGNSVLMMRRGPKQPLPGQWEYPGGKFEPGETGPQCIKRELSEELKIDANVGKLVTVVKYRVDENNVLELHAYEIDGYTGKITLTVHDQIKWVPTSNLVNHPQLPADLLISRVLAHKSKQR